MTAVTRHIGYVPESKAWYVKKGANGQNHDQAIRALGRRLVYVIWPMFNNEQDYGLREVRAMPWEFERSISLLLNLDPPSR